MYLDQINKDEGFEDSQIVEEDPALIKENVSGGGKTGDASIGSAGKKKKSR